MAVAFFSVQPTAAQIVNGDFEAQLQDWGSTCPMSIGVSSDVPPGGGLYSAELPMLTPTESCYVLNLAPPLLYQELPTVVNGDEIFLSYWHSAEPFDPNEASLMTSLHFFGWFDQQGSFIALSNQGGGVNSGAWGSRSDTYTVVGLPVGETLWLALGGHAIANSLGGTVRFDNVQLQVNSSVGVGATFPDGLVIKPILAGNELTVLTDSPIIRSELIDPMGKVIPMKARRDGPTSLVADLNGSPNGIYILMVHTERGVVSFRFPKF